MWCLGALAVAKMVYLESMLMSVKLFHGLTQCSQKGLGMMLGLLLNEMFSSPSSHLPLIIYFSCTKMGTSGDCNSLNYTINKVFYHKNYLFNSYMNGSKKKNGWGED